MIALMDTPQDLATCAAELGMECGQLLTPLTRRANRGGMFGIDNGAFSRFNAKAFLSLVERNTQHRTRCVFVAMPDIVANARRTLELFDYWAPRFDGWPVALVAQDGQGSLPIPWEQMRAVFIGGSTKWKLGRHARDIIKTAQAMGKWVHVGRVNTPERTDYFAKLGVDSIDGTGIARYSHMRVAVKQRMSLFEDADNAEMDDDASRDIAERLPDEGSDVRCGAAGQD